MLAGTGVECMAVRSTGTLPDAGHREYGQRPRDTSHEAIAQPDPTVLHRIAQPIRHIKGASSTAICIQLKLPFEICFDL
jgi:hypothetical protein